MKEKNYTGLVPDNVEGKEITAESSVLFETPNEAHDFYKIVRQRLLRVDDWQKITGSLSANFKLTDKAGEIVNRTARKGDHFRIDIPGPGSKAGEGYDWAYVEDIKEIDQTDVESIAILVRPASNPQTDNNNTAHFFSKISTSTFVITRENNKVTASVYDRNIEANNETHEVLDKVRNSVVGIAAKHGVSKLQWQALTDALVDKK